MATKRNSDAHDDQYDNQYAGDVAMSSIPSRPAKGKSKSSGKNKSSGKSKRNSDAHDDQYDNQYSGDVAMSSLPAPWEDEPGEFHAHDDAYFATSWADFEAQFRKLKRPTSEQSIGYPATALNQPSQPSPWEDEPGQSPSGHDDPIFANPGAESQALVGFDPDGAWLEALYQPYQGREKAGPSSQEYYSGMSYGTSHVSDLKKADLPLDRPEEADRDDARAQAFAQRLWEATDIRPRLPCPQLTVRLPELIKVFARRVVGEEPKKFSAWGRLLANRGDIAELFLAVVETRSATYPDEDPGHLADGDGPFDTASFKWLVAAVEASCRLDYAGATTMASIRATVISTFPYDEPIYPAALKTNWDPSLFIEQQGYKGADCLSGALTLSGTAINIQMLPCRQYLRETWPFVGEIVFEALMIWFKSTSFRRSLGITEYLFDKTFFTITECRGPQGQRSLLLRCSGLKYSISEIIEAFAWLASTLREASGTEVGYSVARVERPDILVRGAEFRLTIAEEPFVDDTGSNEIRRCWPALFNNPVVSKGFPVPFRSPDIPGLEISLEAMGSLVGAPRLTIFNNRAVLKGFNAAIFATACTDETVVWHLVINKDGSRIRYSDKRVMESPQLETSSAMSSIQGKRHFLGWASNVSYNIGSPSANYHIGWSSPAFVGPGCALEKFIISGGPGFLSAGAEFSLGRKDKSPLIRRETAYFDSLNSLSSSYVIFYDTLDHRAWLSNGLHTLLHLVRASLRHDKEVSVLAEECLFDPSRLEEDPEPADPKAAINFLRSRHNLELPIFPGLDDVRTEQATSAAQTIETEFRTRSSVRIKDRVNSIIYVLEQLVDHQANLDVYASGVPLRFTPRGKLEGFRFMDVATRRPLSPRMVSLDAFGGAGKSWVDFTRSIKAVTLFGEGFGELLEPRAPDSGNANICDHWKTLPKGKNHLAVASHDLVKIFQHEGSVASIPLKLAAGIYWNPTALFEACACKGERWRACNRAQALLPESFFNATKGNPAPLQCLIGDKGAVVFGRSSVFPFSWPDRGDPTPEKVKTRTRGGEKPASGASVTFWRSPSPPTTMSPTSMLSSASTGASQLSSTPSSEETGSPSDDTLPQPKKREGTLWKSFKDKLSLNP